MKRFAINVSITMALGLGLALALLWLLGGSTVPATAAPGDVITVCQEGEGCGYPTIQAAVDAATGGEIIKVATGVYTGVQSRPAPFGYQGSSMITQVVYISSAVTIRGGYTTTNGFADPPDPVANPTTLDAQGQGRAVYVGTGITVTLEGLRLINGNAIDLGGGASPAYDGAGGGLYADRATTTISGCLVAANRSSSGGGIFVNHGTFVLQGSVITANVAITVHAGGLYVYSPIVATVSQNTVSSNTAKLNGGGLYLAYGYSDTVLSGNVFVSNTAGSEGGGIFMNTWATLVDNKVMSNTAGSGGGFKITSCGPTIISNHVIGNRARFYGGGIYAWVDAAVLRANYVLSNTAERDGGGFFLRKSEGLFENNIVARNKVGSGRYGAGAYIQGGSPRFVHTTFAQNVGGDGSGVYVVKYVSDFSTVALTNTILVSHTTGIYADTGNTATLNSVLWYGNTTANTGGGGVITVTNGYTDTPAFVNPDTWDYHIDAGSPARDKGVDTDVDDDIDGDPRLGIPDLGADEFVWHIYLPLVLRNYSP